MDDLHRLRATYSSMSRICCNPTVGRRVALDQCRRGLGWDDVGNYYALLSSLTQLSNPEACFLTMIPMYSRKPAGLDHASSILPVPPMAGII